MELAPLRELISEGSPSQQEGGIETRLNILSDIKTAFGDATVVPKIAEWVDSVDKLSAQTVCHRTVAGVVGSTGAGKAP